jgi:protein ImuB
MFACIHCQSGLAEHLPVLAAQFANGYEQLDEETIVFSVAGLGRLFGPAPQLAAEIARQGQTLGLAGNIAMARHPDTAALAARHCAGVTILPPGQEGEILGPLPVGVLPASPATLETLARWGVETIADFLALPPLGVLERLGEEGGRLQALAEGRGQRALQVARAAAEFTAVRELEAPVSNLEPLLFVVSSLLHDLVKRVVATGNAVQELSLQLEMERWEVSERTLGFPAPVQDPRTMLKQVQLALEADRPRRPVVGVRLELRPAPPRAVQQGMFSPNAPEPERLQTLLARLAALTGQGTVGSPELLNTYRPDAWRLRQRNLFAAGTAVAAAAAPALQLALRLFRPALPARVRLVEGRPVELRAPGVEGTVAAAAGPWRTTGEWWAETAWARDEWDLAVVGSGLYRVYRQHLGDVWFVDGIYD